MGYDPDRYKIGSSLTRQFLSVESLSDGGEVFVFDEAGVFPTDYEHEDLRGKMYLDLSDPDTGDAFQMIAPHQIAQLCELGKLEQGKPYLFELQRKVPTGDGRTVGIWRVAPVEQIKAKPTKKK